LKGQFILHMKSRDPLRDNNGINLIAHNQTLVIIFLMLIALVTRQKDARNAFAKLLSRLQRPRVNCFEFDICTVFYRWLSPLASASFTMTEKLYKKLFPRMDSCVTITSVAILQHRRQDAPLPMRATRIGILIVGYEMSLWFYGVDPRIVEKGSTFIPLTRLVVGGTGFNLPQRHHDRVVRSTSALSTSTTVSSNNSLP
jgi:hypothetical protein